MELEAVNISSIPRVSLSSTAVSVNPVTCTFLRLLEEAEATKPSYHTIGIFNMENTFDLPTILETTK
jgi:hypothetical protein